MSAGERPTTRIPPEAFVEAWQASASVSEVCLRLGLGTSEKQRRYLSSKAWHFRRKGVDLKKHPQGNKGVYPNSIDWPTLAQLAKDVGGEE